MLFERIRRTQKPVFLFLAVTFGLGFALLGVGSGAGSSFNFLNMISNGGSSSQISSLQSAVQSHPSDAGSWLKLAQAYEVQGQNDQAISAYASYLRLRPKDGSALATAAGLVEQRGQLEQQNASAYGAVAGFFDPTGSGGTSLSGLKIAGRASNPLTTAAAQPYQSQARALDSQASSDFQQAVAYRQTLVRLDPRDANNQDLLGYDAAYAQNFPVSLQAFKAYLKLVPKGQESTHIKTFLPQLELQAKVNPGASTAQ
jgi:tetratricopeptide (TPR) repeat protein